MGFLSELKEKLLLEVSIDQLKRDWVESGKISQETFDLACQAANNQSAYVTWLVKKTGDGLTNLTPESAQIWQDIFDTFTRHKEYFDKKDINQYKTTEDIVELFRKCNEAKQKVANKQKEKDAKNLDQFKIGSVVASNGVGYLVYKLPQGHRENHWAAIELGHTDHESLGSSGWCTSSGNHPEYWKDHIKAEDLYIFVNPKDRKFDKFQIQFGYPNNSDNVAKPFSLKDTPLSDIEVTPYLPFYDFLHEKEKRAYPTWFKKVKNLNEKLQSVNIDSIKQGSTSDKDGAQWDIYVVPKKADTDVQAAVMKLVQTRSDHFSGNFTKSSIGDITGYYWRFLSNHGTAILVPSTQNTDAILYQFDSKYDCVCNAYGNYELAARTVSLLPVLDYLHQDLRLPINPWEKKLRQFLEVVGTAKDISLDSFKVADGIWYIPSTVAEHVQEWIKPVALGIYKCNTEEKLLEFACEKPRFVYPRGGNYFVSATEDGGTSDVRGFVIYSKIIISEPLLYFSSKSMPNLSLDSDKDKNNRALWDRIKKIPELDPKLDASETLTHLFSLDIRRTFQDLIKQDKEAAAERRRTRALRQPATPVRPGVRVPTPATGSNEALEIPDEFGVATEGSSTFYCVPENAEILRTLRITSNGHAGIVKQGNVLVVLSNLRHPSDSLYENIYRFDATTGNVKSNRINPDLLWKLYDILDSNVPGIVYPVKIQAIHDIKQGEYNEYREEPINGTIIYKLPSNIVDRSTFPYGLPSSWNDYIILGYILSCQFTLSDTGELSVTGRWGTGNSGSAISCLGGLSRVLLTLCNRYNIPRRGAIQQLQEIYRDYNIPCPKILTEALKEDSPKNLTELKSLYSQVLKSEGGDKILNERISFNQYKAMVLFKFDTDKTKKLGSEKLAEMVRALPGATRVSSTSANKENGEVIMSVRLISQKPPKEAFIALKKNALTKFAGNILDVKVAAHSIETKSFVK